MDTLRKIFKDKDKPFLIRLMVLAVLGIVLLLGSNLLLRGQDKSAKEPPVPKSENSSNTMFAESAYERELEERLSGLLSKVEGAGKVEVMISISYGTEIILAENTSSNETWTQEADSAGGSRENRTKVTENNKIMMQGASGQTPLIVKEIVPKVEGVIIVAQGGGDVLIKEALMNAAKTVLGIEIHKVQVLKMKE